MEQDIVEWILEYLILTQKNTTTTTTTTTIDIIIKNILTSITWSPAADNLKLRKLILLRSIESEVTYRGVTERILTLLEHVEEVDRSLGIAVSDSMRSAYCGVAVECSLGSEDGLRRVWGRRVKGVVMEGKSGLWCEELRVWRGRVLENWVEGGGGLKWEGDAGSVLRGFLDEAWKRMGRSFLEVAMEVVGSEGRSWDLDKLVELAREIVRGDGDGASLEQVRDKGRSQKANLQSKSKHVATRRRTRGVKIASDEELDLNILRSQYDTIPTPEVQKLQEVLKSNCLELQNVVKDPLPDVLREADDLVSNLAKRKSGQAAKTAYGNDTHDPETSGHGGVEGAKATVSCPSGGDGADTVANEYDTDNQPHSHQINVPRHNLMERNRTARTLEWDDSIDDSQEGPSKRLKLSTPVRLSTSPLKKYENTKIPKRRRVRRWSNMEEDALRLGVQKFGRGNWKMILDAYRDKFDGRTEVDLKDKWRNMTR